MKWVVDHDRDASLELVAAHSRESRESFKLTWRGRVIPFGVVRSEGRDEVTGQTYVRTEFDRSVSRGDYGRDIVFDEFTSDAERREARLLEIEALLVFGALYDGDKRADGFHRVEFEGKLYRKSDFGLT